MRKPRPAVVLLSSPPNERFEAPFRGWRLMPSGRCAAGVTGGGGVYVVKHHVRRQQAPALDPDLVAKDNEDLKKRLNKLRAATAARSL